MTTAVEKLLTFRAPVDFKAAADDATGPVRCSIVAYTGNMIRPAGWGQTVIDMTGLKCGDSCTLLADHDAELDGILGAGVPTIRGNELSVEGQLSREEPAVAKIIRLSKTGVRFQASVGVDSMTIQRFNEGDTVTVNNQNFTAPRGGLSVIRAGALKEVSILALGADGNTSVSIAAQRRSHSMHQDIDTTTSLETDRTRCAGIVKLFDGKFPELQAKAITVGWDVTEAEIRLLEASEKKERQQTRLEELRAERGTGPSTVNSGGPAAHEVLEASICLSAGLTEEFLGKQFDERVMNAAVAKKRDVGIGDAIFASIAAAGLHTNKRRVDDETLNLAIRADHMLRATGFSNVSAPNILANVQNKFLLQGYTNVQRVWPTVCRLSNSNDFKPLLRVQLLSSGKFEQVGPSGQLHDTSLSDQGFSNQVLTFGMILRIPRTHMISDDVGAFQDVAKNLGRDCALKQEQLCFTALLGNAGSFFSAGNGNYASGGGTALSLTSLGTAETLFRDQTQPNGLPIQVVPKVLLVPTPLAPTARNLVRSTSLVGNTSAQTSAMGLLPSGNPYDSWFDVQTSPWLNSQSLSGSSTTGWYLFGDPNDIAALDMAFLRGQAGAPIVETAAQDYQFDTLGISMRAYSDFGAALQDHRGALFMVGA